MTVFQPSPHLTGVRLTKVLLVFAAAAAVGCSSTKPFDESPGKIHTPMGTMTVEEWEDYLSR